MLVVNERASAVDMSLASKLTSYFSAGRPVVAAVPAGGGTAARPAMGQDWRCVMSAVRISSSWPPSYGLGSTAVAPSS